MRILAILAILACGALSACASDPRALGITGPGIHTVPPPETDPGNAILSGAPATGASAGSASYGQVRGETGFWGYNQ
ncbi:MAG TPA: hypothetical protein VHB27_18230 [Rhodopila sp.]|uniref:hypothetical protein n=1 Tax=Rhodopila sp. TaxID=2480087 RepID=UPI002BB850A4|nr:hypothetical protein [Rhodopila sp.]HVY17167.1 hypothetical protein [Rhodopila sp.]